MTVYRFCIPFVLTSLACGGSEPSIAVATSVMPLATSEPVGTLPGQIQVSSSGSATYNIELTAPEGPGGLAPNLSLAYASGGDNGLVGVGWSLRGLSAITRCDSHVAREGAVRPIEFDDDDRLCLDGAALVVVEGRYGADGAEYRREADDQTRVVSHGRDRGAPVSFTVYQKDGRIERYGQRLLPPRFGFANPNAPAGVIDDNGVVYGWALTSAEDRAGHRVEIDWHTSVDWSDAAAYEYYPLRMRYSFAPGYEDTGLREIGFGYQDGELRPDVIDRWVSGAHLRIARRMTSVVMYAPDEAGVRRLTREYRLRYATSNHTQRSLLEAVVTCDGAGTCLPETSFAWQTGSWEHERVETGEPTLGTGNALFFADYNGDGRDDLLFRREANMMLAISNGNGFDPARVVDIRSVLAVIDIDGDAEREIVTGGGVDGDELEVRDLNAAATAFDVRQRLGTFASLSRTVHAADLDGSGRPNLLIDNGGAWSHLASTDNWAAPFATAVPMAPLDDFPGDKRQMLGLRYRSRDRVSITGRFAGNDFAIQADAGGGARLERINHELDITHLLVDINGDGLDDVFNSANGYAKLNNGNGFGDWYLAAPGFIATDQRVPGSLGHFQDWATRAGDFNGDGRGDVAVTHSEYGVIVYLSRGHLMAPQMLLDLDELGDEAMPNDRGGSRYRVADMDGNGLPDIVTANEHITVFRRLGARTDMIASVTNGLGSTDYVQYGTTTDPQLYESGPSCSYPQSCDRRGLQVVSRVLRDTLRTWNEEQYSYRGMRTDVRGIGFLGFERVRIYDVARTRFRERHYDLERREPRFYPRRGVPVREVIFDRVSAERALITVHESELDVSHGHGGQTFFVREVATRANSYDLTVTGGLSVPSMAEGLHAAVAGATPYASVDVVRYFDEYGTLREVTRDVHGGTVTTRRIAVDNRVADWLLGLPVRVEVESATADGAVATRTQEMAYDGVGRIAHVVVEPDNPALMLTQEFMRDARGLVTKIAAYGSDGERRETEIGYDDEGIHVVSTRNAAGHLFQTTVHPGLGVTLAATDPNGVVTTHEYDGFGRMVGARAANGWTGAWHLSPVTDGGYTHAFSSNTGQRREVDYDRLGRPVASRVQVDAQWVTRETNYDLAGRVETVSMPYLAGRPVKLTSYEYDGAGRTTSITYPDRSSGRRSYDGTTIYAWDRAGQPSITTHDADGLLATSTNRHHGAITTSYTWGPFGQLVSVETAAGVQMLNTYDGRGRILRIEDADAGWRENTYNAFGERISQRNPMGVRYFDRDELGRVERVRDGSDETVYEYDTGAIGRLGRSVSPQGAEVLYGYDALGRLRSHTTTIGTDSATTSWRFDTFGRISHVDYPTGANGGTLSVERRYDANGFLDELIDTGAGASLWEVRRRDEWARVSRWFTHDGVLNHLRIRNRAMGYTSALRTRRNKSDLMHLTYFMARSGHVTREVEHVEDRTQRYRYDGLQRLKSWTLDHGGTSSLSRYGYDELGNMIMSDGFDGLRTYEHGVGAGPHAVTAVDGESYEYDALGRRIGTPDMQIQYTPFNLPLRVESDDVVTDYDYDASGARVRERIGADVRFTPNAMYERRRENGQLVDLFKVFVEGNVLAEIVDDGAGRSIRYIHRDRTGSPRLVTNAAGEVVERRYYAPFGQQLAADPLGVASHRGAFTGHREDSEVGLVYMRGRSYDPKTRRFLTPDPSVPRPMFGQSYNRYGYALNSPVSFVDPDGYQEVPAESNDAPDVVYDYEDEYVYGTAPAQPEGQSEPDNDSILEYGPPWAGGDGYAQDYEGGYGADQYDGVGYGSDPSAPSSPEPTWTTDYPLPAPRPGVWSLGLSVSGGAGPGHISVGAGVVMSGDSWAPYMSGEVGPALQTSPGASITVDGGYSEGALEDRAGVSVGMGASAGPHVMGGGDISFPVGTEGVDFGSPTSTGHVGVGTPGAEVHAAVGGTFLPLGTFTQSSGEPAPDRARTDETIGRYNRSMSQAGVWVSYDASGGPVGRSQWHFGGPWNPSTGAVENNACIWPPAPAAGE